MSIFITNDDGVSSKGLLELVKSISRIENVISVAPDRERSAIGHGISFTKPLRIELVEKGKNYSIYSSNGTPTDCALLGLCSIMKEKPSMVISGINLGANLGDDITYSGTVSSAMEGALRNIPSMAVSIGTFTDPLFHTAAVVAANIARLILEKGGLEPRTLLNVNVPNMPLSSIPGIEITRQGTSNYNQCFVKRKDPIGKDYYWLSRIAPEGNIEKGTDFSAISRNMISITPLQLNLTCHKSLSSLMEWKLDESLPGLLNQ